MKKREKIQFYKQQLQSSRTLKEVAKQNQIIATQLESDALRALEALGDKPKHAPKGDLLSEKTRINLLGNLTR